MEKDDPFDTMRADWQLASVDLDRARRRVARGLRMRRFWVLVHFAGALAATVLTVGFAWRAWTTGDALFALAASGFLVALPLMVAEQLWWSRQSGAVDLGTVHAVLSERRRQAQAAIRLLRGCRLAALILVGCAVGAWLLVVLDRTPAATALYLTAAWGGAAALTLVSATWLGARLAAEIGEIDRLIAAYEDAGLDLENGG